jgi:peptidoglycan/xylan/chitin deacetylase (PgdA/CDA1 family)
MKILRPLLLGMALCFLGLVGGCMVLPAALEMLNPGVIYRIPDAGKTLYLTLDDGPSEATAQILDVLRKHDVPATFFVITDHIRPDLMHRLTADGHQIAHHMRTSASIQKMPMERFQSEFLSADVALSAYPYVKLFRPPNGSISSEQAMFVTAQGYQIVVGTIFPLDHWLESKTTLVTLAKLLTIEGGIMILHDTRERGSRAAAVLDELIPRLKREGYNFALLPGQSRV